MATIPAAQAGDRRRRPAFRLAWRLARIGLLAYLGLALMLSAFQARLIFPGSASQGQPWARVRPPEGSELVTLRAGDGVPVVALFGPALTPDGQPRADAATRPTLLFFYGNGMNLAASLDLFGDFRRLGANVLIPDYPGYGLSGGEPGEAACAAAADAALDHLRGRPDVDPRSIVVGGWSLGAAVAIDLAAREPVAGLVAFSAFTSLAEMARRVMPYLPTGLLLRHRFESLEKIGRVACPILLGHGDADGLIPYAMSGRLEAAARAPVRRVDVPGADHNEFFSAGGPSVLAALGAFLDARATPGGAGPP